MTLSQVLLSQAGSTVSYSALANEVRVSVDTIRRWMTLLESIYFSFRIRPWFRNVSKSLRKQPKLYPWDWSPALKHFAQVLKVPHAFQAVMEMEGVDADCFQASRPGKPLRVPLRTLLSQLA